MFSGFSGVFTRPSVFVGIPEPFATYLIISFAELIVLRKIVAILSRHHDACLQGGERK